MTRASFSAVVDVFCFSLNFCMPTETNKLYAAFLIYVLIMNKVPKSENMTCEFAKHKFNIFLYNKWGSAKLLEVQ